MITILILKVLCSVLTGVTLFLVVVQFDNYGLAEKIMYSFISLLVIFAFLVIWLPSFIEKLP